MREIAQKWEEFTGLVIARKYNPLALETLINIYLSVCLYVRTYYPWTVLPQILIGELGRTTGLFKTWFNKFNSRVGWLLLGELQEKLFSQASTIIFTSQNAFLCRLSGLKRYFRFTSVPLKPLSDQYCGKFANFFQCLKVFNSEKSYKISWREKRKSVL